MPTPRDAFQLLPAGNRRFVGGAPEHPNQDAARRAETTSSQHPFAVLFGCSDSRPATEVIFDRGLGDLFVVRTAGHIMAARAAGRVQPEQIIAERVRNTTDLLLNRSRVLAERVAAGQTAAVGLSYHLADGTAQLVASHGLDAQDAATS